MQKEPPIREGLLLSLLQYDRHRSETSPREWRQPLRSYTQQSFWLGHACFHLARILPIARGAVTFGPLIEALLGRGDIGRVATPGFEHRPLHGTPIREAQGPRVLTHGIHGIEMLCGPFGTLAAREKHDPRHRRRDHLAETVH